MVKANHKLVETQINKKQIEIAGWFLLVFMYAFLLLFNHENVYVNSMIYELCWCVFYALLECIHMSFVQRPFENFIDSSKFMLNAWRMFLSLKYSFLMWHLNFEKGSFGTFIPLLWAWLFIMPANSQKTCESSNFEKLPNQVKIFIITQWY